MSSEKGDPDGEWVGLTEDQILEEKIKSRGLRYGEYLKVPELLGCQKLVSPIVGDTQVDDEMLFVITHQTYELWFKQILFELDIVRNIFDIDYICEKKLPEILKRTRRIVSILKVLVEQIHILETMSPQDFMEFRDFLAPGSGFQSLQFRVLENKLGIKPEQRVKFNMNNYKKVFDDIPGASEELTRTEEEASLSDLVQKWLERTTKLGGQHFDFWRRFQASVNSYLQDIKDEIDTMDNDNQKALQITEWKAKKEQFDTLFDVSIHESLVARGERKLSHLALQGLIMVSSYREQERFHQPFQLLTTLMDIDSFLTKWRYNHMMLAQRMIGSSQLGTGGSSGYHYLRSTLSDRYKVFIDMFNLSTFLIPPECLPPLTDRMRSRISSISWNEGQQDIAAATSAKYDEDED